MKKNPKVKTISALTKTSDTDKVRDKVKSQDNGGGFAIGIGISGSFIVPK